MSVEVHIGNDMRLLEDARPDWINKQIDARRADGISVCVRVRIDEGRTTLTLSTPGCGGGRGGGGQLTPEEQDLVDLWRKHHMTDPNFTGGNLVSFLKQLRK